MSHDFDIEPGLTIGEWLYAEVSEAAVIETDGWAPERVNRVLARLQLVRQGRPPLRGVVPWLPAFTAFTAPGDYVYFGRRLLERMPDDATAAFVLAHEVAHHDLGHTKLFPDWLMRAARRRGGVILVALWPGLERRLYGPERECDADRYAVELCVAAGYVANECLEFFRIMAMICLDLGDRAIVFGPDPDSDQELAPTAPWLTKARIWAWQRTRGYLPLTDREAMTRAHLAALRSGTATNRALSPA